MFPVVVSLGLGGVREFRREIYFFIAIVLDKDSSCHRGKSKLGIGLFIHGLLREPLISCINVIGELIYMM